MAGHRRDTRLDDERDLAALQMRQDGCSATEIGEALGMAASHVRVLTNRIREADRLEHGGEDPGWW